MLSRIICERCRDVLREGDIGAKVEKKICISCVTESTPKADMSKIKQLNQQAPAPMTPSSAQIELENFKERFSKLNIEMPYKKIENGLALCIEIKDYHGKTFAEFALPKEKLLEILSDFKDIEEKEKLK